MRDLENKELKKKVYDFWNKQVCGTQFSDCKKYTKNYFDEIESHRYSLEPEIFLFAQFTRHYGKKVLEVGIGAGSDFLQWVRAGAKAYGVDLTSEAVKHVDKRLALYSLKAEEIRTADCEKLPYKDNTFDVVYSWGVIHHTPDTQKALEEIIRVCRPGGICKVMIYNRHSLVAYYLWIKNALFKCRPWKSLSWCVHHYMESLGTKAFTSREIRYMLKIFPIEDVQINPILTYYDRLGNKGKNFQFWSYILSVLLGRDRVGWFMLIQFIKREPLN